MPVLVLGGESDTCVTSASVVATAQAFGTKAEIYPAMPHAMMLDPEWQTVAERWPISTSATHGLRLLMQSNQLPMWLLLT